MAIRPQPEPDPLSRAWLDTAFQAGHPMSADSNGAVSEGASWTETNVVEGRRQSAADAYLRRVLRRPKRSVVTDAHVTRLEFDAVVAEPNTNPVLQCASSSRTVA